MLKCTSSNITKAIMELDIVQVNAICKCPIADCNNGGMKPHANRTFPLAYLPVCFIVETSVDVNGSSSYGIHLCAMFSTVASTHLNNFFKNEYLEIFLNGKDVSQEVSKLQGCFSRSI